MLLVQALILERSYTVVMSQSLLYLVIVGRRSLASSISGIGLFKKGILTSIKIGRNMAEVSGPREYWVLSASGAVSLLFKSTIMIEISIPYFPSFLMDDHEK